MKRAPVNQSGHPKGLDYLVLLGLVCQGFSFDNWLIPILYAVLWWACRRWRKPHRILPESAENIVTMLAILAAHHLGANFSYNRLVFIGNALVAYQAMTLIRPLTNREQKFSLTVALIHLAVGSQVVVDYKFVLVLIASLLLIPRTLFELQVADYTYTASSQRQRRWYHEALAIAILMCLFFVLFPRFRFFSASSPLPGVRIRPSQEIDMSAPGPGDTAGQQLIFRIEGDDINYIKRTALDQWDGTRWSKSDWGDKTKRFPYGNVPPDALHRSVKMIKASLLDTAIPVDGHVIRLTGNFFQRPYVAEHGGAMIPFGHHRNREYEYWTLPHPTSPKPMSKRERNLYLPTTTPSPALKQWLDNQTAATNDPMAIIQTLTAHFQANHTYQLGTPDLDRLNPIDDFILNRQDGHCERFASALAVLLRMKNIPSRVALGWLAVEKNNLGGFYNVRVRHAHAWTEAWIEGTGWVIADATPYGQAIPRENRPLGFTFFEWLEYTWYSKIVEFGVSEQSGLVRFSTRKLRQGISMATRHLTLITILIVATLAMVKIPNLIRYIRRNPKSEARNHELALKEARHFYSRMLHILNKRYHLPRQPSQTPMEYLETLQQNQHPNIEDIQDLTLWFCEVRYGQATITPEKRQKIRKKLARLVPPGGNRINGL